MRTCWKVLTQPQQPAQRQRVGLTAREECAHDFRAGHHLADRRIERHPGQQPTANVSIGDQSTYPIAAVAHSTTSRALAWITCIALRIVLSSVTVNLARNEAVAFKSRFPRLPAWLPISANTGNLTAQHEMTDHKRIHRKQSSASAGSHTTGSFSLNEVLSTMGIPVKSRNGVGPL
jgi:hypothetical protein